MKSLAIAVLLLTVIVSTNLLYAQEGKPVVIIEFPDEAQIQKNHALLDKDSSTLFQPIKKIDINNPTGKENFDPLIPVVIPEGNGALRIFTPPKASEGSLLIKEAD